MLVHNDLQTVAASPPGIPPPATFIFPTSFSQQRLWFLNQLEPNTATYNIARGFCLRGSLDKAALEKSLQEIVQRHETLRTTFDAKDGMPVQVITPELTVRIPLLDLSDIPEAARQAHALDLVTTEARRPFDLQVGPLLRASLYRLSPQNHILLIVIHHIISDGWSTNIFYGELATLYTSAVRGEKVVLPPLPAQYADYAVWQRQWLQGETLAQHLAYWRTQLAAAPALELPTDYPRPAQLTHDGARVSTLIPPELSAGLNKLSRRAHVTLFMTMLAGFKILLARLSGQWDVVVGTPIAGRNRREIEGLIGFFLNTLVLRTNLVGDPNFLELLARVRETALAAYSHQDIPFEKLLEELKPERDPSRTPFFQVFFNMLVIERKEFNLPGIETEPLPSLQNEAKFDLTVYVNRSQKDYRLTFVYNANLFTQERMQEVLDQYIVLLEQIVLQPETPISRYTLVTSRAAKFLPNPAALLSNEWKGAIHSKLSENAKRTPEQIAVLDSNDAWTYAELDDHSNRLANVLIANHIQRGDIIAIYAHRSASLVCAILGVLKAGAATLILDPAYPPTRLRSYLEIGKPKGWIRIEAAGKLPAELEEWLIAQEPECQLTLPQKEKFLSSWIGQARPEEPKVTVDADDLACVSFTSGSAGTPKGVLGRHGSLTHFLPWQKETFGLSAADRFSMLSGLSHDPLQRDIFTPLWLGATICIPDPQLIGIPGALAQWMAQQQITFAHLTPAMAQLLTETASRERVVPSLRYAFFVGDKLTHHDTESLRRLAPKITCINSYGTTETQRAVGYSFISNQPTTRPPKSVYPVGRGMPDVQLLILTERQQLAGIGEVGEIYVRSPHLAKGYLDDEPLTRAKFLVNPWIDKSSRIGATEDRIYRSGDLGRYLPDGTVEFLGRGDRQFKLRGYRIEASEIESVLVQHPAVREALVTVFEGDSRGPRLIAYVVTDTAPPAPRELRAYLKARLPEFMTPGDFLFLAALPLTPNGKIDFRALPAPPYQSIVTIPPAETLNATERQLADIWQRVLHVEHVGKQDDFFELGGHSLLAVQLFGQIERALGKKLPIAILFRAPTVEELAQIIERGENPSANQIVVPIQPNGSRLPFFCVHGLGGGIIGYTELSRELGPDQPFYGLQAYAVDGIGEPDREIKAMAARYIQAMRMVQPTGPYRIGGYCYGGIVAFEMACQLQEQGHPVSLLGIFEGYALRRHDFRENFKGPATLLRFALNMPFWIMDYGPQTYQRFVGRVRFRDSSEWQRQMIKADRGGLIKPGELAASSAIPPNLRIVMDAHLRALRNYKPPMYSGPITLFRVRALSFSRAFDRTMGWERRTTGDVTLRIIPGAHYNILEQPHVKEFARQLSEYLAT